MNLSRLFVLHALPTFAAGVVLLVAPGLIPSAVGIRLEPAAYLVCYLLGAAELCIAFLSFFARTLTDVKAQRLISAAFIVFHVATAVGETIAWLQGLTATIWVNVALRAIVSAAFVYFGLYRLRPTATR